MEDEISYIWLLCELEYKEYRLYWHLLYRDHELKIWEHTEKMRCISAADIFWTYIQISNSFVKTDVQFSRYQELSRVARNGRYIYWMILFLQPFFAILQFCNN